MLASYKNELHWASDPVHNGSLFDILFIWFEIYLEQIIILWKSSEFGSLI